MMELVISGLLIVGSIYGAHLAGKSVYAKALKAAHANLVTERSVRHNLNCMVSDLRHEVKLNKAEALAFRSLKGQWVTKQKHLVEYNQRKECFRCIGYPGRRL